MYPNAKLAYTENDTVEQLPLSEKILNLKKMSRSKKVIKKGFLNRRISGPKFLYTEKSLLGGLGGSHEHFQEWGGVEI